MMVYSLLPNQGRAKDAAGSGSRPDQSELQVQMSHYYVPLPPGGVASHFPEGDERETQNRVLDQIVETASLPYADKRV